MKKLFSVIILVCLVGLLFSTQTEKEILDPLNHHCRYQRSSRTPNYEFAVNPTNIITTYYDYQPGGYNALPMQIQPEISHPNEYPAGGAYIAFHAKETSGGTRRAYFTYLDADGNIVTTATISNDNIVEGYLGIDIDPVTADPFVVWHANVDNDDPQEDMLSYDFYHAASGAGLWNDPAIAIDNGNLDTPHTDDKFIWPGVNIGPSPLGTDYRRIYVTATNATDHGNGSAHNPLIAYADFTTDDLDNMTPFDWNYYTIPQLDEWDTADTMLYTQSKLAFVTSETDGKVAFIGWNVGHGFVVFLNENYGEGEYTYYHNDFKKYVSNPQNQDGTYRFVDNNGVPYDSLNFFFRYSGYFNAEFTEDNSKIKFIANMGMQTDYEGTNLWWGYCIYPKEFYFDVENHEFGFYDLYPQGANPADDNPMLPWDLDEDGVPDNYDENGIVQYVEDWPFFYYLSAASNNLYRLAKNEEKGWLAAVWSDGLKAKYAYNQVPGYDSWLDTPEIAIVVSSDNGATWSDPIYMNANPNDENYAPELDGMIPCYINVGNKIEDLGEDENGNSHGKLHLFFLDDNSFGSSVLGHGLENGGMLEYAALDITFPNGSAVENHEISENSHISLHVYPNPFQNSISISYQLNSESAYPTEIAIYNIKGQKVKLFHDEEATQLSTVRKSLVWDGKNENGKALADGIYFVRIKVENSVSTKKIMLIR